MAVTIPRIMISAPKKSSGKTLVTLGLAAAFVKRGVGVQTFKKGPDYIDPMWHRAATGRDCHNLDPYMMENQTILRSFIRYGSSSELAIIEGNHGLHDGLDLQGNNSNAYLSKILQSPVLLVVDSSGMNRGIAATVLGQIHLDPTVQVAGVILNNVRSSRQEEKQRQAIEHYCGIPVVGSIPQLQKVPIKERHLGLTTTQESGAVEPVISEAAEVLESYCDLNAILNLAKQGSPLALEGEESLLTAIHSGPIRTRIGVAYDRAFCFYYPENLEALKNAGAELVFFDAIQDPELPEVDGLYLGGGFPESFIDELEANIHLRDQIGKKVQEGMPIYAECGGLTYLAQSITWGGRSRKMVGAIPGDVIFQKRPVGYGYMEMSQNSQSSWFHVEQPIKCHEFHYSKLVNIGTKMEYNFHVNRGYGIDGKSDGMIYKNVHASYAHLHSSVVPEWAAQFVATTSPG